MIQSGGLFSKLRPENKPNWRNPAAYPDPTTANLEVWAEEFMSRNLDFRNDATRFLEALERMAMELSTILSSSTDLEAPTIAGMPAAQYHYYACLNAGVAGIQEKHGPKTAPYRDVMQLSVRTHAELFENMYG